MFITLQKFTKQEQQKYENKTLTQVLTYDPIYFDLSIGGNRQNIDFNYFCEISKRINNNKKTISKIYIRMINEQYNKMEIYLFYIRNSQK